MELVEPLSSVPGGHQWRAAWDDYDNWTWLVIRGSGDDAQVLADGLEEDQAKKIEAVLMGDYEKNQEWRNEAVALARLVRDHLQANGEHVVPTRVVCSSCAESVERIFALETEE